MERSITHLVEERIEHVSEEEFDAPLQRGRDLRLGAER